MTERLGENVLPDGNGQQYVIGPGGRREARRSPGAAQDRGGVALQWEASQGSGFALAGKPFTANHGDVLGIPELPSGAEFYRLRDLGAGMVTLCARRGAPLAPMSRGDWHRPEVAR